MIELIDESSLVSSSSAFQIVRAAEFALKEEGKAGSVAIEIVDEEEIQRLNREFRMKDAVTDVLTFPSWEGEPIKCPSDGFLGDIAICYPRAEEQAEEYGHSLERELSFLTIHGILHILGYDHIELEDEKIMFRALSFVIDIP